MFSSTLPYIVWPVSSTPLYDTVFRRGKRPVPSCIREIFESAERRQSQFGVHPVTFVRRGDELLYSANFGDDRSGGDARSSADYLSSFHVRNSPSIQGKRVARNKHLAVGLFILFMVYSSVSYTIFQTFVCDTLDSGVTYPRADYNLVCWTGTHVAYTTYAGIMIVVYPVGIPVVFAGALFKNRDSIKRAEETTHRTQVPPEAEAIKDLWAPYKRSRYYYEVIECGRRIALTGLAVFIYPGSTAQVAIEALLAFVFSSISEILSPFTDSLDAWLYRSGTWVIFLSMYLALLLKMEAADEESHSQDVFAGLLIVAHVGMILVVIANALLSAFKGFREVRAIKMPVMVQNPSGQSRSASTTGNGIDIIKEAKDDASNYSSNPIYAGRRQTNFASSNP